MRAMRSGWMGGLLVLALAAAPATAQCTAPAGWFPHARTPAPNPDDPAFADHPEDHCQFHRWAWQTFLWLTQDVGGQPRLIAEMHTGRRPFDLERIQQDARAEPLEWAARPRQEFTVRPRDSKPEDVRGVDTANQPGDNGILLDQRGHPVYFAIHVNQKYYDFIKGRRYYIPEVLRRASPVDQFPIGTLELKSSWRLVEDGEDVSDYYTAEARIEPIVSQRSGATERLVVDEADRSRGKKKIALVGLHVVGVVRGHPEFIWATFEHRRNAPMLPPGMTLASPAPVSASGATFYRAGTPASACNLPNDGAVKLIDPQAQTFAPITQVARVVADGGGRDAGLVRSLDQSVREQLGKSDPKDPAAGYDLVGTLWVDRGVLEPNTVPGAGSRQEGSLRLANTTMETFRQPVGNCFTCHDTRAYMDEGARPGREISFPPKNLNVSHALRRTYVLNEQYLRGRARAGADGAAKK